ncbi:MAG: hypothetical protein JW843_11125 [Candidatus Aminicenantes bacterium]|nr:hypothetical protein [Candidatus Aminicenantes bacterium]
MKHKRLFLVIAAAAAVFAVGAAVGLPPLFITSDRCLACHNGLTSPKGEDISIGTDWRASMMANAARDPYWQASIRRETLANPKIAAAAEHECSACHMPMARYQAKAAGGKGGVFVHLPVVPEAGPQAALAVDGVSCTLCHQIGPENLGRRESFTAGFVVDTKTPAGARRVFGPYDIDQGRRTAMRSSSGFVPEKADHIRGSELCASCHTLFTHAYNDKGEVVGELPEQVPYLEWKHSAYNGKMACQACHMPPTRGKAPISSTLGQPREDSARHVFRGGNFFMPNVFNLHRDELGLAAEPLELAAVSSRTAEHLQAAAAKLTLGRAVLEDGRLLADATVANLAGHKLPSAYPSRRVWVHFTVLDGRGSVVFESGRFNPDGSIAGNDNDADPARFEPHYSEIRTADQVQIYEPILGDPDNRVTTVLLAATQYLKDNRILPMGFDKTTAPSEVAVYGAAREDGDFEAGADRIRFNIPLGSTSGPYTVKAELWYQPISYRWGRNVEDRPSAESERFAGYFKAMGGLSGIVLARAETKVGS